MFIISSVASLAAKVVTLTVAVALAAAGLQEHVQPNHFLLLCRDNATLNQNINENNEIGFCISWEDCFNSTNNLQQKFRICKHSETSFHLYFLLGLTVSTIFALLATFKLHKISDYEKLFQDSKSFLFLFPTKPVVHRKLLLDTVKKNKTELLKDILKSHTKKTAYSHMMALFKNIRKNQEGPVNSETIVKAKYLDRANPKGYTPLHISCMKGYSESTESLINAGANINITDPANSTALHIACNIGSDKCTDLILKSHLHHAEVNKTNYAGYAALHLACIMGSEKCTELIIQANGDVEKADHDGNTALHLACKMGSEKCTDLIIKSGAKVNKANSHGNTALHLACISGSDKCIQLLFQAGATLQSNSEGEEPDFFGEDPSQAKIRHLTVLAFRIKEQADRGKLEKRYAFEVVFNKGKSQRSLWELLETVLWKSWHWEIAEWQHKVGLMHRVENSSLAMALVGWKKFEGEEAGRREKREEDMTKSIMQRGFRIPLETVPEGEQEELEAAVEDWNKYHNVKCEYPLQCLVSSVVCVCSMIFCKRQK